MLYVVLLEALHIFTPPGSASRAVFGTAIVTQRPSADFELRP